MWNWEESGQRTRSTGQQMELEEKSALVGELALGLLDADERRSAESLVDDDFAARREYAFWQDRLAALAEDIPPVEIGPAALENALETLGLAEPFSWRRHLGYILAERRLVLSVLAVKVGTILLLLWLLL